MQLINYSVYKHEMPETKVLFLRKFEPYRPISSLLSFFFGSF